MATFEEIRARRANGWTLTKRYGWIDEACASDMRGGDQ